jgi:predicted nuclease of predicted toxin-antitoxin system
MPITRIYLDEYVNHAVVPYLRQRGWDITTAQAEGMGTASDEEQLNYATSRGWVLLSTNERDFGTLHLEFRKTKRQHSGIIIIPQRNSPRFFVRAAMMLDWIKDESLETGNRLFRWNDLQQRLIGKYMPEGYSEAEIALALGRTTELP